MKGDLWENQLFSVKKVLKSAKQRYSDRQRVCFSNCLVLVYIRKKFGDYSERLADLERWVRFEHTKLEHVFLVIVFLELCFVLLLTLGIDTLTAKYCVDAMK